MLSSGCLTNNSFVADFTVIYHNKNTATPYIINNIYEPISNTIDELYIFTDVLKLYATVATKTYSSKQFDLIRKIINNNGRKKLVIIDSCILNKQHHEYIDEIAINGRHTNIKLVIATQSCMALKPLVRCSIDNVVCDAEYGGLKNNKLELFGDKYCVDDYRRVLYATETETKIYNYICGSANGGELYGDNVCDKKNIKLFDCINNTKYVEKNTDIHNLVLECNQAINSLIGLRDKLKLLV